VKPVKTPMAKSGISESVFPPVVASRIAASSARA
jgi:hypothetical protein